MTAVELATVAKEVIVTLAALTGAIVAVYGVRGWFSELRGKTNFDVARRLMKATYHLRDQVAACRSPMVLGREFPPEYPGQAKANAEQELDAWAFVYKKRWAPVWDALQEFDAGAIEAEALWGRGIREKTDVLRKLVIELNWAIDAFLSDKYNRGEDFRTDKAFGQTMRGKLSASIGNRDNPLSTNIEAAIAAIESEIRPHIGGD